MAITYRNTKGSDLTPTEVDNNFLTLDQNKLDKSVLANNNTLLIRDASGNLVELQVDFSRIVGRLTTGEIVALTKSQLKGLLEIAISDVSALQDALDAKAEAIHTHAQSEITGLVAALDAKSDDGHTHPQSEVDGLVAALAAKQNTITPDAGWANPTGTADKAAFDTDSVSVAQLARRVKALIDGLKTQGILS